MQSQQQLKQTVDRIRLFLIRLPHHPSIKSLRRFWILAKPFWFPVKQPNADLKFTSNSNSKQQNDEAKINQNQNQNQNDTHSRNDADDEHEQNRPLISQSNSTSQSSTTNNLSDRIKQLWVSFTSLSLFASPLFLLFGLIFLIFFATAIFVWFSYLQKNMSTALSEKDAPTFYSCIAFYIIVIAMAAPLISVHTYLKQRIVILWREEMTKRFMELYFENRNYYSLAGGRQEPGNSSPVTTTSDSISEPNSSAVVSSSLIDNPDQRICEDIHSYCRTSLSLLNEYLEQVTQIVAFSGVLWSISPFLVLGLVGYSLLGTFISLNWFGRRFVVINTSQSQFEANLRFAFVRIRSNAQSIAMYSGEAIERSHLLTFLSSVIKNMYSYAQLKLQLSLFRNIYKFSTFIIPSLFIAPYYFAGEVEFGTIAQTGIAFRTVFASLTTLVNKLTELSKWNAGVQRLWELKEGLEMMDARRKEKLRQIEAINVDESLRMKRPDNLAVSSVIRINPSSTLKLSHLTVMIPTDVSSSSLVDSAPRILAHDLNLALPLHHSASSSSSSASFSASPPSHLLIMSASGVGKSTLLRSIAGLWSAGSGSIDRPSLDRMLFLPQKPYMSFGSLRQQLIYPMNETGIRRHDGTLVIHKSECR